ncbi:MAG: transposase [Chloroflexi bacterium]|nr:transposase [Chloroflexota bacterium]
MPWTKPYHPPKNQRLDPELYKIANDIYFLTVRAFLGKSTFTRDELNQRILGVLRAEQERQNCSIFTYCLMPDHLHFLISPNQDGISVLTFTDQFKGKATNESWTVDWKGKLWQPRYFDHIVRTEESLWAISEYILDNPVRKGLVENREDWKWSGLMNPLPER